MSKHSFLRYNQPGATFYTCTIKAPEIIHRLAIRRRSDSSDGIQRDDDRKRVRDIGNYLGTPDAIIPTPIIVSAYENCIKLTDTHLEISENEKIIGHILDGQHRVLGLKETPESILEEIELLIVFVFGIDTYSEATIFTTINSNQKQVSKSLIYDLFALDPKRSKERVCHEIVKSLNDDPLSPFHKRIKILGKKIEDTESLSQSAFIDQLLKTINKKSSSLIKYYEKEEDWVLRKLIINCFKAIDNAIESTQNKYPKDYFYRTSGYGGVTQALSEIVYAGEKKRDISEEFFEKVFTKFFELAPTPPEGTGNSSMIAIRERIIEALRETKI
ncbi:DGQHR domain-containing protein [Azotobacter bryophylli]|uniref:DGQHR domain-containing protein n=1 Tax=Azotobacter bryophylli TaxID=1986537 RepID=A0ABV7AZM2_9GAMM